MKKFRNILSLLLVVLIAVSTLTGCNDNDTNAQTTQPQATTAQEGDTTTPNDTSSDTESGTTGEVISFTFEMTDKDGETKDWNLTTAETMLDKALIEAELIEGEEGEWGWFVTVVDGVAIEDGADAYWELQVDGEYSMLGVSSVEIVEGATYAFVYTTF
jgi:hypothetical protein